MVSYGNLGGIAGEYGRVQRDLSSVPPAEIVTVAKNQHAKDIILLAQSLISAFGKDEAAKLIKNARYEIAYKEGRKAAEKLGNPKDLDSYAEEYFLKSPRPVPVWVAQGEFLYRTRTKAIRQTSNYCFEAEAFKRFADKEMLEFLAENYCIHDGAWARGFNPDIKFKMTKHFLRGDDCCEFTFEL